MQTYEILVRNRSVLGNSKDMTLVRTSVGIDRVHVLFDNAEWLDFPVSVTFGHGSELVTQSIILSAIPDSEDWVAEATVLIPHEVIDENGSVRVTFQGTDSSGRHIVTAAGSPLTVVEAGDVDYGDHPSDLPTIDQWMQAYAESMAASNHAESVAASLEQQLNTLVGIASEALDGRIAEFMAPATTERLGVVRIGDGIDVDDGIISVTIPESTDGGMTEEQRHNLAKLISLSRSVVDATYAVDSVLGTPRIKPSVLPLATVASAGAIIPDGTTIRVDWEGVAHAIPSIASTEYLGVVKPDGTTIMIDSNGTIHSVDTTPVATTSVAGKVMPDGTTIRISNGVIRSVVNVPIATRWTAGKVKPDGTTITVDADGTIHGANTYVLRPATTRSLGGVKPDGTTITVDADGTIHGAQTVTRLSQLTNDAGYVTDTDLATSETNGICRPDNETTFVNDGVISAIDYSSQMDDLLAMIASLRRRVAALEGGGSAASDVTYENGSLMTGWTYDNYAMLTDSEYDNGSIA